MKIRRRRFVAPVLSAAVATLCTVSTLSAADLAAARARALPAQIEAARIADPDAVRPVVDASLANAQGRQQVIVRLRTPAVGGGAGSTASQVHAEQTSFLARLGATAPSARVLGRVQLVLNAVFLEVDASEIHSLRADGSVTRIAPVGNYEKSLSETVPYIGGETLHGLGTTGKGVRVAVLDSGVDYTHKDLGGSGNPADFAANDPNVLSPGDGFPNSRVVGGTDLVGGLWPNTPGGVTQPDDDPLDKAPAGQVDGSGHGTHVSSIIAGVQGVAPDAKLYAVKVCSSVSTSCSGVALIQGMEFAVDPNGDGDPSDHVDIVNMSLGSDFGQPFDDDLSTAVDNATYLGVLTAAAAGNAADRQFIVSTPSAALTAISVAQTAVPSEKAQFITIVAPALGDKGAVPQAWSPSPANALQAALFYDTTNAGTRIGCSDANGTNPWTGTPLAGRIVLVDRGTCAASLKISNIGAAGGIAGIIGFVDASIPFSFAFGGGTITIPGYAISQVDATTMKTATTVKIDPANQLLLVGSVVSTSSRGPMFQTKHIKPEIGAPGASVSAEHGTGTGRTAFGGTSGATPMISGSAALLLQFYRDRNEYDAPSRVKQALIMSADTSTKAPTQPGALVPDAVAPISRIGGGEVRVDRAALATAEVGPLDPDTNYTGGLSFGYVDVDKATKLTREVGIGNNSWSSQTFTITSSFRYANDAANGAVTLSMPSSVTVPGMNSKTVKVTMNIDGTKLRDNLMNAGDRGADPRPLTANEYDGYITFTSASQTLTLPWHVLPRKAAKVDSRSGTELKIVNDGDPNTVDAGTMVLRNRGVGTANVDAYALMAISNNLPEGARGGQNPTPDLKAVGVNTFPVGPGVCATGASFVWAFAFSDWERLTLPGFYRHEVLLDTNRDGVFDWIVFNAQATSGQVVTFSGRYSPALDGVTGATQAFFLTENGTNSTTTVLYICANQVGLTAADLLTRSVDAKFRVRDFYFGGDGDEVNTVTLVPFGERFLGLPSDIAGNTSANLDVLDFGEPGLPKSPDLGLLVITNGDRCSGAPVTTGNCGGSTLQTESLLFAAPGGDVFVQ